jgi:hypothetical protein
VRLVSYSFSPIVLCGLPGQLRRPSLLCSLTICWGPSKGVSSAPVGGTTPGLLGAIHHHSVGHTTFVQYRFASPLQVRQVPAALQELALLRSYGSARRVSCHKEVRS